MKMAEKKTRKFTVKVPNSETGTFTEMRVLDFIENFLYIKPKPKNTTGFEIDLDVEDDAPLVLFKLNPQQRELYDKIEDDWCHYRPIRYVILKARQIGFSTLIAAIIFTLTIYDPYKESLIIADIDKHTKRIFLMYQRFYDNLPEAIKPSLVSNKKGETLTTGAESTIGVETVSEDIARGSTLKAVHASEYGVWRKQRESLATLMAAVPNSPNTLFFIESTARGINYFRELFTNAYEGKSRYFKAHFAPWYLNTGYREVYHNEQLFTSGDYDDEVQLFKEYSSKGMTVEGLMWRRTQIDGAGLDLFHQEYPTFPEEAFLSTGVSVFNPKAVGKRLLEVQQDKDVTAIGYFSYDTHFSEDGNFITINRIRWHDDPEGDVVIYERPRPGYPYVIGGDPARLSGKDFYVAQVIRHDGTCRNQVAMFRKQRMDADEFGFQLYCLGKFYNTALIAVETNTTTEPIKILTKAQYPKIYVRQRIDSVTKQVVDEYGISTQSSNKESMIDTFKARFRQHPQEIVDETTLKEMLTFIVLEIGTNGNYKIGAATSTDHDDTVMAMVIAHTASESDQQTTHVNVKYAEEATLHPAFRENKPQSTGGGIWRKPTIS